ncbi:MAG: M28 family peptidase [Cyanobacteria bacterium J06628_6]
MGRLHQRLNQGQRDFRKGQRTDESAWDQDDLKSRLVSHVQQLSCDRNPFFDTQGHFYVQQYIKQQLSPWGTVVSQTFQNKGRPHHNWCLNLPGQSTSELAPIIVGAHYDTVPGTVGADDNATGLAVLIELARLWSIQPGHRPLWLVAFDLEEFGWGGSRDYVNRLVAQRQPVHLMLSLEMLGYCDSTPGSQRYPAKLERLYPDTGDFIALIGNWQRIPTLMRLKRALLERGTPCQWLPMVAAGRALPATRRSDHAPFWDAGYDAVLVTDTADLRNPHYHRASDTTDTLDFDFLTGVCGGLLTGLQRL